MNDSEAHGSRFLKNRPVVTLMALISIICLGLIDYITGWELGFFVFYFVPISFAAWYGNFGTAIFLSVVSAGTWFIADIALERHYSMQFYSAWNGLIRLLSFIVISYTISKAKSLLLRERKISHELHEALDHIKVLKGLLPICASCKKIRNDKGYWEQIEKYIGEHSDASFTHSLCAECARKLYPELFEDCPETK